MTSDGKKPADILPWYAGVRFRGDFHSSINKAVVVLTDYGRITYELKLEQDHVNFSNTTHGGLLMTVIDESCILSVWLVDRGNESAQQLVTVNANINCISAASLGETLIFDAVVTKSGATLSYVTCTVTEKTSQRLIATGNVITFTKTKGPYLAFTGIPYEKLKELVLRK